MRNALFALQAAMPALLMLGVFVAIIAAACLVYSSMLLFRRALARWRSGATTSPAKARVALAAAKAGATSGRNTLVSMDPHYFDLTDGAPNPPSPEGKKKREAPESNPLN